MEKLLIYKDDISNKFWKINVNGNSITVTYGKVGTVGSVKIKEFVSDEMCQKEANKLIQSKLKKGYLVSDYSEKVEKDSAITEDFFWELLATAKNIGEDPDEQLEWLISHLSKKSVKDIVMFDYIFNKNYYKSYTSNLWAAAYIIMGGCSDNSFDYFRAWLLFLGKDYYEKIINNPEEIVPHLKILEEEEDVPELEDLLSVASMAYEEKTGFDDEQYFNLYNQLSNDTYVQPEMEFDWDEDDEKILSEKFPLLWKRYSDNPLG